MEKKNYQTPTCIVVELKPRKILMTSGFVEGVNYDKREENSYTTDEGGFSDADI